MACVACAYFCLWKGYGHGHAISLSCEDHATRCRIFGIEDAAERHRTRTLHRTGARTTRCRDTEAAAGAAPEECAGLLRCAGGLGHAQAIRRTLCQHSRDGPLLRSE